MNPEPLTEPEFKADALTALVLDFRAGMRMSTRRVGERFGVSQRTAQRWVKSVQKWEPLEFEHGVWRAKETKR